MKAKVYWSAIIILIAFFASAENMFKPFRGEYKVLECRRFYKENTTSCDQTYYKVSLMPSAEPYGLEYKFYGKVNPEDGRQAFDSSGRIVPRADIKYEVLDDGYKQKIVENEKNTTLRTLRIFKTKQKDEIVFYQTDEVVGDKNKDGYEITLRPWLAADDQDSETNDNKKTIYGK